MYIRIDVYAFPKPEHDDQEFVEKIQDAVLNVIMGIDETILDIHHITIGHDPETDWAEHNRQLNFKYPKLDTTEDNDDPE